MIGYEAIKHMAEELGRPVSTLIALAANNDPFYLSDARVRDAEWFAAIYHEHGFGKGVHLRRIHYRLVSTSAAILLPDGMPYANTDGCWTALLGASLSARYAGLVPLGDFVDRRNPDPVLYLADTPSYDPEITGETFGEFNGLLWGRPNPPADFEIFLEEVPELAAAALDKIAAGRPVQPYHIELWCEKTTIADILGESYNNRNGRQKASLRPFLIFPD